MDILIILLILVGVLVIPNIKIVSQARVYVVERIGSYHQTCQMVCISKSHL